VAGDLARLGDRDQIRDAADLAGAGEVVSRLPGGYDTLLSRIFFGNADTDNPEVGVTLSGGQWQRLALARALLALNDRPGAIAALAGVPNTSGHQSEAQIAAVQILVSGDGQSGVSGDDLRQADGPYKILTADEAAEDIRGGRPLPLHPLCGGIPPDAAWRYLENAAAAVERARSTSRS